MVIYTILFLCSCLIALVITPILRRTATENGFLDYPDERKIHKSAVPRIGGVAIVISSFISITLGYVLRRHDLTGSVVLLAGFSLGAALVVILGILDDLWGVSAGKKFIGQVAAALILAAFGFTIRKLNIPFVGVIDLGWKFGIPFSIFWIVGIINAINFIDGMDGLATGVIMLISSALFVVSVITGQLLAGIVCLVLVGSLVGFLRYNFHPASIFMGDCGTMFLGFTLAAVSIKVFFQNPSITASSVAPVLIFGLPIADATWAITRRLSRQMSPFRADGLHIHHRLMSLDLTQRQAVVILYAVSSLSATAGLVVALTNNEKSAVVISVFMLVVALVGITALNSAAPFKPAETQTSAV